MGYKWGWGAAGHLTSFCICWKLWLAFLELLRIGVTSEYCLEMTGAGYILYSKAAATGQ